MWAVVQGRAALGGWAPPMEGQDPPDYLNEHDKDGAFTHTHAYTRGRRERHAATGTDTDTRRMLRMGEREAHFCNGPEVPERESEGGRCQRGTVREGE